MKIRSVLMCMALFLMLSPKNTYAVIDHPFDGILERINPRMIYAKTVQDAYTAGDITTLEKLLNKALRIATEPNWLERRFDVQDSDFSDLDDRNYYVCTQFDSRLRAMRKGIVRKELEHVGKMALSIKTKNGSLFQNRYEIDIRVFSEALQNGDMTRAQAASNLLNGYFQNETNDLFYLVKALQQYFERLESYMTFIQDIQICKHIEPDDQFIADYYDSRSSLSEKIGLMNGNGT